MYIVRALLETAIELLSKMLDWSGWMDGWVDTPYTVMTTRGPAVLKNPMKLAEKGVCSCAIHIL